MEATQSLSTSILFQDFAVKKSTITPKEARTHVFEAEYAISGVLQGFVQMASKVRHLREMHTVDIV